MAMRLSLPDAWETLIFIVVPRLDEAFALIDAGKKAARRDAISANIRVWSMLRSRVELARRAAARGRPAELRSSG